MLHVTCDLCGKQIRHGNDQHFILKLEVFAAQDPCELTESDLDSDHMEEICELLNQAIDLHEAEEILPTTQQRRYDLCRDCREKYLRDPLHREIAQKLDFSENSRLEALPTCL